MVSTGKERKRTGKDCRKKHEGDEIRRGAENDEVPRTARNTPSNGHSFILGIRIYLRKRATTVRFKCTKP
ncbi:unnamed protein product [Brugia pahangi]|uniref:Uncharacterized protein n=1 Tax=Brugia pahangi TaxID=6280 RepID=A0A0N4TPF6_BRUPA|nr:unnamed protein product [Brugia pahangi]